MDTTTAAAFWEGIASSTGGMITANQTFWILTGQVVLVLFVFGILFYAFSKAVADALRGRFKGRKR